MLVDGVDIHSKVLVVIMVRHVTTYTVDNGSTRECLAGIG